ncbi:peptidase C15, pyroglutamyl peptidase I-like protein [Byssothecium circinans]|uniref:Peptidase C15, pyroglutamyl peptidase I-like protein n=1 Tax=Byssothecium circinans TaxID=147558 RepID=A0A6A5TBR2_9PLEO|nr:peptidase C15, pyroglutamyl peptidase I-like protein [Byssothecium circinans]KAF1948244.1 peptidase C15, pyroglutamyl peptidase I-like protein [Byssothecium circinans]
MPRAWSTTARQPPPEKGDDPVTVLVTGFGPFLGQVPINSSWEIASHLPALIPASLSNPTPIRIYVHHEPIRVAYRPVIALAPTLLPPSSPIYPKPDIILHIGLAAGRPFYTLEEGSHARGYGSLTDVDGERYPDSLGLEKWPEGEYPNRLLTSFNTKDVLRRWRRALGYGDADSVPKDAEVPDVRISKDAGNFMCGFIYYNSLAHYYSIKKDEKPVVFLHVPDLSDSEEKLETGREVAIALIKALVESRREVGVVEEEWRGKAKEEVRSAPTDVNFA